MSWWRSRFILRVLAVTALLGAGWQTTAGHLEHLGIIPHVHIATDLGADAKAPTKAHGLTHHHHLPDLDLPMGAVARQSILMWGFVREGSGVMPPEAPITGIEHPPQLS